MYPAKDIANIILTMCEPDVGDVITNLKLQKLLYYVQGFHIAMFGNPLFKEDIVAWQYGPVVSEVYHEFKQFGSGALDVPKDIEPLKIIDQKQYELLRDVYDVYGQFSALKLMNMTHNESPWLNTKTKEVITHELLYNYFINLIDKDGEAKESTPN